MGLGMGWGAPVLLSERRGSAPGIASKPLALSSVLRWPVPAPSAAASAD